MTLSDSAREVFVALAAREKATRPQLAAACALSKPTVSSAVSELESAGLVERNGTAHGATGRSAAVYRLGKAAGYTLAVDRGSTQVAFRTAALDGRLLDEGHTDQPESAAEMIRAALRKRSRSGPLRSCVVAVSDVVSPNGDGDPEINARVRAAVDSLALPAGLPVTTENNVNCAAIAELHENDTRDTFVFLQVGVGIGAGVVVNRRLVRGANGAAGEVARLAYPWTDGADSGHEALEARLGSPGLLGRVRERWSAGHGPAPDTAAALFALAEAEHPLAVELVDEHSAEVGKLAASIGAVLDPGLLILGGGVGSNPLLTDGVNRVLNRLSWPVRVLVSQLGERATVLGAAHLAREQAIRATVTAD